MMMQQQQQQQQQQQPQIINPGVMDNGNNNGGSSNFVNMNAAALLGGGNGTAAPTSAGGFNFMAMGGPMNMAALGNMQAALGGGGGNGMLPTMISAGGNGGVGGGSNSNNNPNSNNGMNLAAAAQAMNMNAAMQNFNLNDLKRLQQLQQLSAQNNNPMNVVTNTSNQEAFQHPQQQQQQGMGVPQQQQQQGNNNNNNLAVLQSYLDQKIQSDRFGSVGGINNSFQGVQGHGQNPIQMFNDQLMMNQNSMMNVGGGTGAAMSNPGEASLPSPHSLFHRDGSRRMRGGVIEPFPEKLHRLLLEVEAAGRGDVISFVANGRAFAIHKPDKFFKEIVPLYFRQSRLSSFKRQLNLYGFELINTGPARGGYYHELFVKDRPEICRRMRRVAVKVTPKDLGDTTKPEKVGTLSKEVDTPVKIEKADQSDINVETNDGQPQEETNDNAGEEGDSVVPDATKVRTEPVKAKEDNSPTTEDDKKADQPEASEEEEEAGGSD